MGIITVTASREEQHARAVQLGELYAPTSVVMVELAKDMMVQVKMLVVIDKLNDVTAKSILARLEHLRPLVKEARTKTTGHSKVLDGLDLKRKLTKIYNMIDSMATPGILKGIGKTRVLAEIDELATDIDQFSTDINTLHEENIQLIGLTKASAETISKLVTAPIKVGKKVVVPEPDDEEEYVELPDAPPPVVPEFNKFKDFAKVMPGPRNKELIRTIQVPLIATFNGFVNVETLKAKGITASDLAGYVVMHDMTMLAVNTDMCEKEGLDKHKVVANSMIRLSSNIGRKVSLVNTTPIRYKKGGWDYYWFAPETFIDILGGRNIDAKIIVLEFQFPF